MPNINNDIAPLARSVFLYSLPRSGSTWASKRLEQLYKMIFVDEPLREAFIEPEHPLFHAKVLRGSDYGRDDLKDHVSEALFAFLREKNDILIKETNCLHQIPFLRKQLPSFDFVFLKRHVGAVLSSHAKIPDIYYDWHYEDRIASARKSIGAQTELSIPKDTQAAEVVEEHIQRYREYLEIYNRADACTIRGKKELAALLAHLSVQSVEGQRNADKVINYESLFRRGFSPDILTGREASSRDVNQLDTLDSKGRYIRFGTKNPTNPYSWVLNYTDEDWQITEYILGKHMEAAFPDNVSIEDAETDAYMPAFAYTDTSPDTNHEMLGNRLVTTREFAEFINDCLEFGITDIFHRLCIRQSSQHSVRIEESGRCIAKEPRLPITLVSPLAALAYARYHRAMLPTPDAYKRLHENTKGIDLSRDNANFGESIAKPSRVGLFDAMFGFYDLYGNVREIMHSEREGTVFYVGGSHKDEREELSLDNLVPTQFMLRDTQTGFRLMRNHRTPIEPIRVLKMIAEIGQPNELFEYLSSMRLAKHSLVSAQ